MSETATETVKVEPDYDAISKDFMPVKQPEAEAEKPKVEEVVETEMVEPVRSKEQQMQEQILSALKKLGDRQDKLDLETAGRLKPPTVEQQEEQRVIHEKRDRAILKLKSIKALPAEEANVHTERDTVLEAAIETDDKLDRLEKEVESLRIVARKIEAQEAWEAAIAINPDAKEDFKTATEAVFDALGKKAEKMDEADIDEMIQEKYQKMLTLKKKPDEPAKPKEKTAPRTTPKTTGGGTIVAQHSPGVGIGAPDGPTFESVGNDFLMARRS